MPAANCCEVSYRYLYLDVAGQWHFDCGEEPEEEVKFCPFCGASLERVKKAMKKQRGQVLPFKKGEKKR